MVWENCEWEGTENATLLDLPTISKYIKGAKPGLYPVLKVVFLLEKKLFIVETAAFKVFYGKARNPKEYEAISANKVVNAFYAIEIKDSNWRLSLTQATAKYDRFDKNKCIVWEAPPTVAMLDEKPSLDPFGNLDIDPF